MGQIGSDADSLQILAFLQSILWLLKVHFEKEMFPFVFTENIFTDNGMVLRRNLKEMVVCFNG